MRWKQVSLLFILHAYPDTQQHALTRIRNVTYLWRLSLQSSTPFILEKNYLQLLEHPCHFISPCLCPNEFFWLENHSGSSRQLLFLSHELIQISPCKDFICIEPLQGQVVHPIFWIHIVPCTYHFYSLYETSHPCIHQLEKMVSLSYESGTGTNARNLMVRKIQGCFCSPGSNIPL